MEISEFWEDVHCVKFHVVQLRKNTLSTCHNDSKPGRCWFWHAYYVKRRLKYLLGAKYAIKLSMCVTGAARMYFICVASVPFIHYDDVILGAMASQITSLMIVYSIVYSGTDQRCSASLAFVWGIHREFPAQRASYAENVSIWWRHHVNPLITSFIDHSPVQIQERVLKSLCDDCNSSCLGILLKKAGATTFRIPCLEEWFRINWAAGKWWKTEMPMFS